MPAGGNRRWRWRSGWGRVALVLLVIFGAGWSRGTAVSAAGSVVIVSSGASPDSACVEQPAPWAEPEEVHLALPIRRYHFLGLLHWENGRVPAMQAASDEVQRRLRLSGLDLDRDGLRVQKDYGRRLSLLTTTGLGSAAEDALEADYRLWAGWYLRSETRERGETFMELRREILFR